MAWFSDCRAPFYNPTLTMPAKSIAQQRLFGMVHAAQKGTLKHPSPEVKKISKGISFGDAKAFASTKHKGLPERVRGSRNNA